MICDGKQENKAICFKNVHKRCAPASRHLTSKQSAAFHLILCEQFTSLIIDAEHDLIKGGMFYPGCSLHHPEEASPPLSSPARAVWLCVKSILAAHYD